MGLYDDFYLSNGIKVIGDPTEREVLSEMIGELRAFTIDRLVKLDDSDPQKQEMDDFQLLLRWEERKCLGTDEIACSIQDKVRRAYKPLLMEYYNGTR